MELENNGGLTLQLHDLIQQNVGLTFSARALEKTLGHAIAFTRFNKLPLELQVRLHRRGSSYQQLAKVD
jgi:hypothetical protein